MTKGLGVDLMFIDSEFSTRWTYITKQTQTKHKNTTQNLEHIVTLLWDRFVWLLLYKLVEHIKFSKKFVISWVPIPSSFSTNHGRNIAEALKAYSFAHIIVQITWKSLYPGRSELCCIKLCVSCNLCVAFILYLILYCLWLVSLTRLVLCQ